MTANFILGWSKNSYLKRRLIFLYTIAKKECLYFNFSKTFSIKTSNSISNAQLTLWSFYNPNKSSII